MVQIRVSAEDARHRVQDLQSLALHEEAVRLVKANPALVSQAQDTVKRWLASGDTRSASLWREWLKILGAGAWRKALGRTRHAQQLHQASPLVTLLPEGVRLRILKDVHDLKGGIEFGSIIAPAKVLKLVPTMPIDDKEQRTLRATIRRWAKAVRHASHPVGQFSVGGNTLPFVENGSPDKQKNAS